MAIYNFGKSGLKVNGIPIMGSSQIYVPAIPNGKVYFVSNRTGDSGSNNNPGTFEKPFQTLAYAVNTRTLAVGDTFYVLPGHSETITAELTLDQAYTAIIGIMSGGARPVIIPNGTIDAVALDAAGCRVENMEFGIPGTDAQTADIDVTGAKCAIINTLHHGSTTGNNKVNIITVTATANDLLIDGVRVYNTTVEVPGAISIEGACSRLEVRNCMVYDTIGYTNGAIYDGATALEMYIHHNVFSNAKANTVCMEFGNNSTGVCSHNFINGRNTTIAANVTTGTGIGWHENMAVEQVSLNAILIPVADAE